MWAGGRLTFLQPLRVGDPVGRTSTIGDVTTKEGRSGPLVFALVRHEIAGPRGPAIVEEHDIVYRDTPAAGERQVAPPRAPVDATWTRPLRPDDVLLFRYSALTFNGHRIHYDRRYVTEVEGYPGLVVHGPLIATLLLDLVRRHLPDAVVARFSFRALSPLFDIAEFTVNGRHDSDATVALWAANADGGLAMDATATLA
jgi:3-methylfumaryl-CoA hydratase